MFGDEKERDGKVSPSGVHCEWKQDNSLGEQTYIDYSPDRPLYPCVFLNGTSSVLAKVNIIKIIITLIFKGAVLRNLAKFSF